MIVEISDFGIVVRIKKKLRPHIRWERPSIEELQDKEDSNFSLRRGFNDWCLYAEEKIILRTRTKCLAEWLFFELMNVKNKEVLIQRVLFQYGT